MYSHRHDRYSLWWVVYMMIGLVVLPACTVIVGTYNPSLHAGAAAKAAPVTPSLAQCERFVLPDLEPIPTVPDIPDKYLNNKEYTDNVLVNKIRELRQHAKREQQSIRQAYEEHLKSCR